VSRPRIRIFWFLLQRLLTNWRSCPLIVKPQTVIRWHRKGLAYFWRRKFKPKQVGAPPIGWTMVRHVELLLRT
jgi:putative transposase